MLITAQIGIECRARISIEVDEDAGGHAGAQCRATPLEMKVIVKCGIIDTVKKRVLVGDDRRAGNAGRGGWLFPETIGEVDGEGAIALFAHCHLVGDTAIAAPENAIAETRLHVAGDKRASLLYDVG